MAKLTDTQIRSHVQSLLARHLIDTRDASIDCAGGVVRLEGKIERSGVRAALVPGDLEKLERDLTKVWGVTELEFELDNWRRIDAGDWMRKNGKRRAPSGAQGHPREEAPRRAWGRRLLDFLAAPGT